MLRILLINSRGGPKPLLCKAISKLQCHPLSYIYWQTFWSHTFDQFEIRIGGIVFVQPRMSLCSDAMVTGTLLWQPPSDYHLQNIRDHLKTN